MIYNDSFQKDLEKDLYKIYKNYDKKVNINLVTKIENDFKNMKIISKESKYPLIKYSIKNNKVFVDKKFLQIYKKEKDDRLFHNLELINNSIKWAKENKLSVPNTSLYIWISDRFPYHTQNLDSFPIYVYSRPENIDMPIFPDNTFYCLNLKEKYRGKCYDWDSVKNIIKENCKQNLKDKKELFYFKGTDTTKGKHNLRNKLFKEMIRKTKKSNLPISIYLDAWKNYEPIYNFCNYLFLLNLPGHYPWSNRLKYLFLMNSIIINVNIELINIEPYYVDKKYITLIDYVMKPNNYIDIVFKYYRCDWKCETKALQSKLTILNDLEFDKFLYKLKNIYLDYQKQPIKYEKMIKSSRKRIEKLNNERIYQYIYKCILLNSELIK